MIYFVTDGQYVKIGFTNLEDVYNRVDSLQIGNARKLTLLGTIPGNTQDEAFLHNLLSDFRIRGEWFNLNIPMEMGGGSDVIECECEDCHRTFGTMQALNAHQRWCAGPR